MSEIDTPTPVPTPSPVPPSEWKPAGNARLTSAAALREIAATGPRDAWAVGYQRSAEDREGTPALQHWDGVRWTQTAVSENDAWHLVGVSAASPSDAWIVGNARGPYAAHWDGLRWRGWHPYGDAEDYFLTDVTTGRAGTWFAGRNSTQGLIARWTSRGFRTILRADGQFLSITAAPGHVWAVGSDVPASTNGPEQGMPMIWHGRAVSGPEIQSWERITLPEITGGVLRDVWMISPSDVWAVGGVISPDGAAEIPLVLHWDGTTWGRAGVPVSRGGLQGVTASGAGDVWLSGADDSQPGRPLFLHFDGRSWTASYGPLLRTWREEQPYTASHLVRVTRVARVPGTSRLWAVGSVGEGDDEDDFVLTRG
ncbi:hypothetical protein [Sphaerisporangium sp. NPDC051011]|uniref:hypothetical protein n=1 Tax=Sphaerisporangium sp. NPDC051011 TaxID=3155792 RepID=UPI0033DF5A4A